MKIFRNISELVGNTPLLEVSNFMKEKDCGAVILCKLEGKNPAGSAKDRVAKQMIEEAEKEGGDESDGKHGRKHRFGRRR